MVTAKSLLYLVAFASLLAIRSAYCHDYSNVVVGILPTYDAGGEDFGPLFKQHLPLRLYRQLEKQGVRVLLLNPGGNYKPDDEEWLMDYGKQSGADLLLITSLLKTQFPEHGDAALSVKCEILDLNSGVRSPEWQNSVRINRRDLIIDYRRFLGFAGITLVGPDTPFEKLPLGKAMIAIGDQIGPQLLQKMKTAVAAKIAGTSPIQQVNTPSKDELASPPENIHPADGPCDITLKILYVSKHAASKSYTIFVQGREESLGINEGVLLLHEKMGPLLLQWSMHDPPYRLPVQEYYQATPNVDCSKPERQLTINIGASGEALLAWQ
ncbi:MAG TPA: hypothetical protein VI636_23770 [Candidatus Angelobacter sp.]